MGKYDFGPFSPSPCHGEEALKVHNFPYLTSVSSFLFYLSDNTSTMDNIAPREAPWCANKVTSHHFAR